MIKDVNNLDHNGTKKQKYLLHYVEDGKRVKSSISREKSKIVGFTSCKKRK